MPLTLSAAWQSLLLVASVILAGGWLLVLRLVCMPSRQRQVHAQPATGDLGPEPPAVAGMLCHGGRVGDEAAAATLLDLAARHIVGLSDQAGTTPTLCRLLRPDDADLAPYERRILSYLNGAARRRAVLTSADAPAWSDGLAPGLNLATLVTARDAADLLGTPADDAQALDPFAQIPGAAANPLTRNAVIAACRWTATADASRSVDVFAGTGLGARALLGQLLAQARRERGRRLGQGVMLAGNVLVITQHGTSAAVMVPQSSSAALEQFAPVLAARVGAGTAAPSMD
jgi:hypothetical protein